MGGGDLSVGMTQYGGPRVVSSPLYWVVRILGSTHICRMTSIPQLAPSMVGIGISGGMEVRVTLTFSRGCDL